MDVVSDEFALNAARAPIISERQHAEYPAELDKLMDKARPTSDEEKYAEVLVTLIEAYEEEHHAIPDASPVEVLRALMEGNNLRQKDLVPIFNAESIVSEVLSGKRELNKSQIEQLSKRFRISPAALF